MDAAQCTTLRNGLRIMALRALGDSDAAEDVAQEALTRALAAVADGRLRDPARLGAFVYGIAQHVITDAIRARARMTGAELGEIAAPQHDPLAALVSDERVAMVRSAVEALSPEDRALVELVYHEGLTPREIARRLGEPSTRIRKRKSRVIERLRKLLSRERISDPRRVMSND